MGVWRREGWTIIAEVYTQTRETRQAEPGGEIQWWEKSMEKKSFTTAFHCLVFVLREIPALFLYFAPTARLRNWYGRSPLTLETVCLVNANGGQLNKTGKACLFCSLHYNTALIWHMSKKSYAAIVAKSRGIGIQIIISDMNPVKWLIRRLFFSSSL